MKIAHRLFLLSLLLVAVGCLGAPVAKGPLTGRSYEIQISDSAHPKVITVRTDDEVRWVNTTKSLLELSVEKPMSAGYSCRNGFADEKVGDFAGGTPYRSNPDIILVATLESQRSASLCFSGTGIYDYTLRRIIVDPGEEGSQISGTVMVK
jgi:plastocyanin